MSPPTDHRGGVLIDTYSGSQDWTKGRYQAPGRFRHATRPCQDYRHRIVLSLCMRGPWLTTHPRLPSGGTNSGTGARSHIRPRNIYTRIFIHGYFSSAVIPSIYLDSVQHGPHRRSAEVESESLSVFHLPLSYPHMRLPTVLYTLRL